MRLRGSTCAVLLLLLVTTEPGDNNVGLCPKTEVANLREALRQTACTYTSTTTEMFYSQIQVKHGVENGIPSHEMIEHTQQRVLV